MSPRKRVTLEIITLLLSIVTLGELRTSLFGGQSFPAPTKELAIEEIQPQFELPRMPYNAFAISSSGDFYFLSLSNEQWKLFRRSTGGWFDQFILPEVPELRGARVYVMQDLAVDRGGSVYVPAVWRATKENQGAGVFVFTSAGQYNRTVILSPRTEVRHIAVADDGNIFVLGVDPAYFRGKSKECTLVHRYDAQGQRMASFSPCPPPTGRRPAVNKEREGTLDRFMEECARGHLWIRDGLVYNVLPLSRRLRVFELDGSTVQDVELQPPAGGIRTDAVWRVFQTASDAFFIAWLRSDRQGNLRTNSSYFGLTNLQGYPISKAAERLPGNTVPVISDNRGNVFLISRTSSGMAVGISRVGLR